jgi:hypothetical protein
MQTNKKCLSCDRWLRRLVTRQRERTSRQGRIIYRQMLRGAAYSLGSGAVNLVLIWVQAHR